LAKDRTIRGQGGHWSKHQSQVSRQVDKENERLLQAIKFKKSTIDFKKMAEAEKRAQRIKENLSFFPTISESPWNQSVHLNVAKLLASIHKSQRLSGKTHHLSNRKTRIFNGSQELGPIDASRLSEYESSAARARRRNEETVAVLKQVMKERHQQPNKSAAAS